MRSMRLKIKKTIGKSGDTYAAFAHLGDAGVYVIKGNALPKPSKIFYDFKGEVKSDDCNNLYINATGYQVSEPHGLSQAKNIFEEVGYGKVNAFLLSICYIFFREIMPIPKKVESFLAYHKKMQAAYKYELLKDDIESLIEKYDNFNEKNIFDYKFEEDKKKLLKLLKEKSRITLDDIGQGTINDAQGVLNYLLKENIVYVCGTPGNRYYGLMTDCCEDKPTALAIQKMLHYEEITGLIEMVEYVEDQNGIYLAAEQREAVKMVIENTFSVLIGGPGTGKTTVLKIILEIYQRIYPGSKIGLAAPSWKAARRMEESTGLRAISIHKFLKANKNGEFLKNKKQPLDEDFIIIDEASMINLELFKGIINACTKDTKVLFLGDTKQLRSIGYGNVLSDLQNKVPTTTLTQTFRQSDESVILKNAKLIENGISDLTYNSQFIFLERKTSKDMAMTAQVQYMKEVENASFEDVMMLSPYRRYTKTGCDAMNERIRDEIKCSKEKEAKIFVGKKAFYEKDRIVFTKNISGFKNGDLAEIEKILGGSLEIRMQASGEIKTVSGDDLNHISLSYCTTIHKSQGSEASVVIVLCDPQHKNIDRNMIYTAITRAKDKVIIIGSKKKLEESIRKKGEKNEKLSELPA